MGVLATSAIVKLVSSVGERLINKFFPDPEKAQEALLELRRMDREGELAEMAHNTELMKGQLEINKVEAASGSLFIGGWRPAIGWTCAISLFVYYVPYCLAATVIWAVQSWQTNTLVARPDLGIADLLGLVMSMLGIAGMRTYERQKGIASMSILKK